MKIAIVGTGYVGLVTGACFAELGVRVTCVDTDAAKIERLKAGEIPIYEPNLAPLVAKNQKAERLKFTTKLEELMPSVEIIFLAVGTPPDSNGAADMQYVMQVADTIGRYINRYTLVVTKSTVPVGTAVKIRERIKMQMQMRGVEFGFDVASNPEFLKEGNAIEDFMRPDRVVVGTDSERARILMTKLYKPLLLSNFRVMFMDIASAEMAKYASNAMLATRISFMNEIANLCSRLGANVNMVRKAMGADSRIGNKFLYPGCGYGGSCFPKDIKALVSTGIENGSPMELLEAVERVNQKQKGILAEKLIAHFASLGEPIHGKRIALWGLAFKPGTDDMREAPSLVLIEHLLAAGCCVQAFDPVAMDETHKIIGDSIKYTNDIYEAALDADAIVLVTEWKEFRIPNWEVIYRAMHNSETVSPVIVDGRNIFDRAEVMQCGFTYYGIGV